jgi:hypothetical protein
MAGLPVPGDRVIDGQDQSPFLSGELRMSRLADELLADIEKETVAGEIEP